MLLELDGEYLWPSSNPPILPDEEEIPIAKMNDPVADEYRHELNRGRGYKTPLEKIQLGETETMFLKNHNHLWSEIPSLGQVVYLRENSNIS